jgi:DNA-binding transcriptional LysR family regulator
MDRLQAMGVYARVVERRSFTLAARDLGLPRSTVTDAVKQLEARLGVQLLVRTTRHVRPTLDGDAYYQRCRDFLADIEDLEASFSGAKPKGLLRVDVQGTLLRHFLLPRLQQFLEDFPEISLHIGEGDRLVDLVHEGIDCVLRAGTLTDSEMIARKIVTLEQATIASPAYLAAFGTPKTLDDLDGHRAIGFFSTATGTVLPLEFVVDGTVVTRIVPSILSVNGADSYAEAARLGLGIAQAPRYRFIPDLEGGRLVELLADWRPPPMPVSLLYPRNRQLSPRVRVFLDWVTEIFASDARE